MNSDLIITGSLSSGVGGYGFGLPGAQQAKKYYIRYRGRRLADRTGKFTSVEAGSFASRCINHTTATPFDTPGDAALAILKDGSTEQNAYEIVALVPGKTTTKLRSSVVSDIGWAEAGKGKGFVIFGLNIQRYVKPGTAFPHYGTLEQAEVFSSVERAVARLMESATRLHGPLTIHAVYEVPDLAPDTYRIVAP